MRILRSRQELEEAWQRAADSERRLRNALRPRYSHYLGPKPGPDARAASWAPTSGRLGGDQALPGFPSDGETVMEGGPSA